MNGTTRASERKRWPPYWLQVRSVSNSAAVRLTILIPIVGYWIIFNDYLLSSSALLFDPKLPSDASSAEKLLSVSWRLYATYFGLCFVAVASGIYQALCPTEVKQYDASVGYTSAVAPYMSDIEEARVRQSLDPQSSAELESTYRAELVRPQIKSEDDRRREEMRDRANVLKVHFDQCNRSYPTWRSAAGFCYIIGALILLGPALDIFRRVMLAMVRSIGRQWFGL